MQSVVELGSRIRVSASPDLISHEDAVRNIRRIRVRRSTPFFVRVSQCKLEFRRSIRSVLHGSRQKYRLVDRVQDCRGLVGPGAVRSHLATLRSNGYG